MLSPTSTAPVAPVCIIMLHYHESKHWTDYFFILYTIYYIRYQYYIYTSYDMIYIYHITFYQLHLLLLLPILLNYNYNHHHIHFQRKDCQNGAVRIKGLSFLYC